MEVVSMCSHIDAEACAGHMGVEECCAVQAGAGLSPASCHHKVLGDGVARHVWAERVRGRHHGHQLEAAVRPLRRRHVRDKRAHTATSQHSWGETSVFKSFTLAENLVLVF